MTVRNSFVANFGEENALAFEAAAEAHDNGLHPNRGSDPFKWVLMLVLSYECASKPLFAFHHGITAEWELVDAWIEAKAEMGEYDGDVDFLAFLTGTYNSYTEKAEIQ